MTEHRTTLLHADAAGRVHEIAVTLVRNEHTASPPFWTLVRTRDAERAGLLPDEASELVAACIEDGRLKAPRAWEIAEAAE